MFKFLALFVLIWIFIKAAGQILKLFLGGSTINQHRTYTKSQGRRQGNIHVDHTPDKDKKGYEGGEYVDYEEVD